MDDLGVTLRQGRSDAMSPSPTTVRWRILALLMAFAGLCHFNRISISVAGTEHLMREFSIDETQMGMVYSSYLFVYTLCMLPGGWLIDRFGPKRSLMLMGLGSAILVSLTGLTSLMTAASMLAVLCLIRALLGVVSAPMHPGAARAVSFWIPRQSRGAANGFVTCAAVIGVASTYYVFGSLMDLVGWPSAFLVAGVVTLLLTLVWATYATDSPSRHRGVNERERQSIEDPDPPLLGAIDQVISAPGEPPIGPDPSAGEGSGADRPVSFGSLLRNRNLMLLTISYATASYFQYLFFYWMQYYFDEVLSLGRADGRLFASMPTFAMAIGMLAGGYLSDYTRARFGARRGRAIAPFCGMMASAALLTLGILVSQPALVVACFTLAMGALGTSEATFWVTGIELGGKRGGLSAAILNAGGNVGGIMAPVITPLFSSFFGWQAGLGLASVLCVVGAFIWWWIEPSEPGSSAAQKPAVVAASEGP